jgi:transposase
MPGATPMTYETGRVEVVTSIQRRRRWTAGEKVALVEEANQPGSSVSYVARKYGISASQLFRWRRLMAEGGKTAVQADDEVVASGQIKDLKRQIRQLERLLGRKTMEVEILKEALEIARSKKLISRLPLLPGDDSQ